MSEPIANANDIVKTFTKIKKVAEEMTPEEQQKRNDDAMSSLQNHPGFTALKEYIDSVIKRLETLQGLVETTDSVETIGFRFLACQTASYYLRMIIELPYGLSEVQKRQTEKPTDE